MRRSVRSPVSLRTTSAISSSVCRLPFISSSAFPRRTSSTAFSAAAWLCGTSTISYRPRSSVSFSATARIFAIGPTRIGRMIPASAASIAPDSEELSHGCATAVGIGDKPSQRAISRSYFSCWRSSAALWAFIVTSLRCAATSRRRGLQSRVIGFAASRTRGIGKLHPLLSDALHRRRTPWRSCGQDSPRHTSALAVGSDEISDRRSRHRASA